MNYMTDLAADLAEVDSRARAEAAADDDACCDRDASAAGILLADVMQSASLMVVVTSLFNALERGTAPPASLAAVRTFMPSRSVLFDAALTRLVDVPGSRAAVEHMQTYCHELELAIRLSASEFLAVDEGTATPPVEAAASAWRSVCLTARKAVSVLADLARARAVSGQASGLRTLRQLADAGGGSSPALDASGSLTLPDWVERRRVPRTVVNEQALVEWGGRMHGACILDCSDTGLRVRTPAPARPGDTVTIVRRDGPSPLAVVRWAAGGSIGLEYTTPDCPPAADDGNLAVSG